jgi:hypothetical protein
MKNNNEQGIWDDIQIFTAKGARIAEPKVTILDSAQILFNAAFVHRADISNKNYVVLGYSAMNKAIIFQFNTNPKTPGALKIVKRSGGASIGTRSFFNFYLLKPKKLAGHYIPKHEKIKNIGEVWVISLKEKLP